MNLNLNIIPTLNIAYLGIILQQSVILDILAQHSIIVMIWSFLNYKLGFKFRLSAKLCSTSALGILPSLFWIQLLSCSIG